MSDFDKNKKRGGGFSGEESGRATPFSENAERGVLGSLLLDPSGVLGEYSDKVTQEHFYNIGHGIIFATCLEMWEANCPIDMILLTQKLSDRNLLAKCGGPAYVTELFSEVPTAANVRRYLDTLQEKYILRRIIDVASNALNRAYEDQEDVNGLLDETQARLLEIGQETSKADSAKQIKEGIFESIEVIENAHNHRGRPAGIPTGFHDLDRMTGGLQGQYIIIAGRPSMGKSALLDNICEHVAVNEKKAVLQFSLEMNYASKCMRLLCSNSPLNLQRVRDGFMKNDDFPRVTSAGARLCQAPIYIDDTVGLSTLDFKARCRRWVHKMRALGIPIGCIGVDYLQLMKCLSKRAQANRQLEVGEVSAAIKETGRELGVTMVVPCQLNRNPDDRRGGKPRISDLRESGAIENDADVIGLLHREEYYNPNDESLKGKAELNIAKQRNGPTGPIEITFKKEYTKFLSTTEKFVSNNEQEHQAR